MPKKAVAIFFLAAFVGAVIFVYFTFPRTKDEMPKSNNQRPFPSAPEPTPNSVPVPETVPRPTPQKVPPGPTIRVMAWASAGEAKALEAEADAFGNATGRRASLTIDSDSTQYRRDLQEALASGMPPDVCLITARDFSGLDPTRDLVEVEASPDAAARSVAAFTVKGEIKAVPDEFSVDVLFYNAAHFDRAGIGYPDRHWNWDILEAISRALGSLQMKDVAGQPIYPLEIAADFDLWNILCTEAGHPALDLDVWHLSDTDSKPAEMRGLDLIREIFHDFAVTTPLPKNKEAPGALFAQQRASLLIAPSELAASLPNFRHAMTLLPSDLTRASLARVNGWAVTAKSSDPEAARALAAYLAYQPVHAGWSSVQKPPDGDETPASICYEALGHAVIPRIEPGTAPLAQYLDQQIDLLARDSAQKTDALYAGIQAKYQIGSAAQPFENSLPPAEGLKPGPRAEASAPLRGL